MRAGGATLAALGLVLTAAAMPPAFGQQSAGNRAQEAGPAAEGRRAADRPLPIAAWSRTAALAENEGTLVERGGAVFNNWCSACHSRDTRNAPGTVSLEHKYRGELPAALEDRKDLTPDIVAFYVRNGVATMPFFRPTEIGDEDLEALAAYLAEPDASR